MAPPRDTSDLSERLDAVDELAVNTAKRLGTHITSSGEVHRDLRGRARALEERVGALERLVDWLVRQRPPSS